MAWSAASAFSNYTDVKVGDKIEVYETTEVAQEPLRELATLGRRDSQKRIRELNVADMSARVQRVADQIQRETCIADPDGGQRP